METVIATTKINGLDNEVSLIHKQSTYVVSYGHYRTYHDTINEAFEDYMKAIEIAYDDYR